MTTKDEGIQDRYFGKKQKKRLNWENLLSKCSKCGSIEIERMNMYKGMFKVGKGLNYQLYRCKSCGKEEWKEI
jgi:uncharacterized protein with PIN domain